ncbi:MAG: gamma-glutamyltransferase [Lutibacter sp.]|nr:gamma-glutamyltransferase [Lutibacter sp.]
MKRIILFIAVVFLFTQCKNTSTETNKTSKNVGFIADSAMVVSAREEASKIGVAILRKGGNAFDAMIATELALAVAYPFAGNIGGGGFMVYRTHEGKTGALDYREKAPLAASKDMYLDENGNIIAEKSTLGAMAVGVPGTVDGLFKVYEKFGSLPFSELIQPAIDLANKGVVVTEKQAERLANYKHYFSEVNDAKILLDADWKAGDTIKYVKLAETLERIRDLGRDGFYKGETAEMLVNYVQKLGGIITKTDLENYEAKWRNPIEFNYKDLKIIAMSPPSSGGICLAQIFKAIEPFDIASYGHNSLKSIQLLTEAERRAYADRSYYLGDPDFVKIPIDTLVSSKYVKNRMANFSWDNATPSSTLKHGNIVGYESDETTHYSIVDKYGNSISATTTLNGAYGSKVYVSEGGFFLNNEMDDFSSKPGVPNMFGLIGAEANSIQPEKRMLSSMTPTIVEKNNQFYMSVGSPGGSTIITSVLQTILNVYEFKMGMQDAVNAPRFHHQWLPDVITMEPKGFDSLLVNQLQEKGYHIKQENTVILGKVDAILRLPNGKLEGGADYRGDDKAAGF